VHVHHYVTSTNKLAVHEHLRDGRPFREIFHTCNKEKR
jgi:hypothetical protein